MLTRLHARRFKSLLDLSMEFPRLTVLFGPNASGKSNVLEAAQTLSQCATARTLADALEGSIRGYPLEAFSFPPGGLSAMLRREELSLSLHADLSIADERYRYGVEISAQPVGGSLAVRDETLTALTRRGVPSSRPPVIGLTEGTLRVRAQGGGAHPRHEPLGLNHTLLSDTRFSGNGYSVIERCRSEFEAWRIYYLDPRVAMRSARPPAEVTDIGVLGGDIAPFLYRLKAEEPRCFEGARRALVSIVPSVQGLAVDLDDRRGILDVQITQDGCAYSSRVISEGTLRVLALCAIAVNPWAKGLVAFEEPENGVHPRRLELIAQLLVSMAIDQGRQVIVTTHSPLFCSAVLELTRGDRDHARLYAVRMGPDGTVAEPLSDPDALLEAAQISDGFAATSEDNALQGMLVRGWLDE